jgi:hypothetical protein
MEQLWVLSRGEEGFDLGVDLGDCLVLSLSDIKDLIACYCTQALGLIGYIAQEELVCFILGLVEEGVDE